MLLMMRAAVVPAPALRSCMTLCCAKDEESEAFDSLQRRVAKARLTEEWSASILKRKPRFLPFIGARQWARAMPFETREDWMDWIDAGEKRNPYIPSQPDVVYRDQGWESWDDFLNGPVEPANVVFREVYKRGTWLRGPLSQVKELRYEDDKNEEDKEVDKDA